jgi:hypothetical protein
MAGEEVDGFQSIQKELILCSYHIIISQSTTPFIKKKGSPVVHNAILNCEEKVQQLHQCLALICWMIAFRRYLVGNNLIAWQTIVVMVSDVQLTDQKYRFRWMVQQDGKFSVTSFLLSFYQVFSHLFSFFWLNVLLSFLFFWFNFLSSFIFTPLLFHSCFIHVFCLMWFHL